MVVWSRDSEGNLIGYHSVCAAKINVQPSGEEREPYYTEICRFCARFLDSPPKDDSDSKGEASGAA